MKIRLGLAEVTEAVTLYLNQRYVRQHVAKLEITTVTPKYGHSESESYIIEAEVTLPERKEEGE